MAVTLAADIDAATHELHLDAPIAGLGPGRLLRIDDEVVEVEHFRVPPRTIALDRTKLVVTRGARGTTPATHDEGTAVLGAQDALAGSADETAPSPFPVTVSETDPGAIGAGALWLQSGPSVTPYVIVWLRNEANDGWLIVTTGAITRTSGGDVDAWDEGFQSNLYLAASGSTQKTHLVDGTNGVYIGQGNLAGVVVATQGGLSNRNSAPRILALAVDPSADAGVAAPAGSIVLRKNGTAGELWLKVELADTAWAKVATV